MDNQQKPQNPNFPSKKYDGMSVNDFIATYPLTLAQVETLKRLRTEGRLY